MIKSLKIITPLLFFLSKSQQISHRTADPTRARCLSNPTYAYAEINRTQRRRRRVSASSDQTHCDPLYGK